nr:fimbrin, SEF 17 [Salmonella enteritidis, 27655, Peptide Partial, 13 aa] [Salmonella enterica subsp. enterica serovar Enteritidis]
GVVPQWGGGGNHN